MIESLYIVLVVLLLLLAALDLFVGVSNDAVNFLNSAVGTRVASLGMVMAIASLGVLLGATFSSGMMEVARKGMFHPELFSFYDVMLILSAVMIADILLLSIFNSFGLPTSTTVSIIFELLGAAVLAAAFRLYTHGQSFDQIIEYIKLDRTATIVSAILLSVVISFAGGMLVQFVCRVLFSFRFQGSLKIFGGLFTGFSLTAIAYFLLIKGAKGASFMTPEALSFIKENTRAIMWALFAGFTVLGQAMVLLNLNVFKLIILAGTFALAFSFAGNDLVNFVGVPLAALDAWQHWRGSGVPADAYAMNCLNENAAAGSTWLVISGIIMCFTLWVSKKARRVIRTAINLSSSKQGQREQFGASAIGRVITRVGLLVSRVIFRVSPEPLREAIGSRYVKPPVVRGEVQLPFDYLRASINLVVASALISFATSLKLPLSTTYVTFMVAMGTSFADGAWDRDSAVYRISGVVAVIGGWFLTGFSAFLFAFITALALYLFGALALFPLIALVFGIIIYSDFLKKEKQTTASIIVNASSDREILEVVAQAFPRYYDENIACLKRTLEGFFEDNELRLRRVRNKASNILERVDGERSAYYALSAEGFEDERTLKSRLSGRSIDSKFFFYHVFSNLRYASKAVKSVADEALSHVSNRHRIFEGPLKASLMELYGKLEDLGTRMPAISADPSTANLELLIKQVKKINRKVDKCQKELVAVIARENVSMHSSEMYLSFLRPIREVVNRYAAVAMQSNALSALVSGRSGIVAESPQTTVMPASLNSENEQLGDELIARTVPADGPEAAAQGAADDRGAAPGAEFREEAGAAYAQPAAPEDRPSGPAGGEQP